MEQGPVAHRVYFPQYRKGRNGIAAFDGTILDHARKLGIEIEAECGGAGTCGRCLVRIDQGAEALNSPTAAERDFSLGQSERLACHARIAGPGDVRVFVRSAGRYSILSETVGATMEVDPLVQCTNGHVVWDNGDEQRVLGPGTDRMYGLAVDVGTTTVVAQLLNLQEGKSIGTAAMKNPQAAFGDDVITRISHTMRNPRGRQELQETVIRAVNELLGELLSPHGLSAEQVYEAVIVGNPTMRNLFFGLEVESLGVIPFEPPSKAAVNMKASALGLHIHPEANVYGAALIGGHAGADCLADIVAADLHHSDRPSMIIDIGTNGEVALGNAKHIMTASCAAGGAYEGATVTGGVGAVEGAISNVHLRNGHVECETIGGKPPIGICGSGLIDLLGELLRTGVITRKAKLTGDFRVTDAIALTQQDVYHLITAKAGLRTDQDLLLKYYGLELEALEKIYLAGGFGNYIDVENAVRIGLLPDATDKIVKIGNGALDGAARMLLSRKVRREAEACAETIEHTRPNEREPEFAYLVAEKMYF
ncbi:MAG: DUF4445 domain-containing protein [Armatimonadetes bacterium]|nr:DUF4445 domain-containing protein [Armatimonadota bacterium]